MAEVNREAQVMNARRLAAFRPPLERFAVGDAVAVHYSLDHGEKSPGPTRGVVIGQRRKGLDSSFTILNAVDEEWYSATYTLSSPLLRSVKVVRRNHHSDGACERGAVCAVRHCARQRGRLSHCPPTPTHPRHRQARSARAAPS
jgi:ribosomal protein L19